MSGNYHRKMNRSSYNDAAYYYSTRSSRRSMFVPPPSSKLLKHGSKKNSGHELHPDCSSEDEEVEDTTFLAILASSKKMQCLVLILCALLCILAGFLLAAAAQNLQPLMKNDSGGEDRGILNSRTRPTSGVTLPDQVFASSTAAALVPSPRPSPREENTTKQHATSSDHERRTTSSPTPLNNGSPQLHNSPDSVQFHPASMSASSPSPATPPTLKMTLTGAPNSPPRRSPPRQSPSASPVRQSPSNSPGASSGVTSEHLAQLQQLGQHQTLPLQKLNLERQSSNQNRSSASGHHQGGQSGGNKSQQPPMKTSSREKNSVWLRFHSAESGKTEYLELIKSALYEMQKCLGLERWNL